MFGRSSQFSFRLSGAPAGSMAAIFLGVGASLFVAGCASMGETGSHSVENQLVSYRHRSDVPWGAIPVVPGDSARVVTQIVLQAGSAVWSRADETSLGKWSGPGFQGTGEVVLVADFFRFGIGGRYGIEPSSWASIGLIGRSPTGMNLFAEGSLGLTMISSSVDLRVINKSTFPLENGATQRTVDTFYQKSKLHESFQGFSRISLGILPAQSGPWFVVQAIPSWTMAEWSAGFDENEGIRTDKEDRTEDAFLLGLGAGWTRRFGNKTVSFGARYSALELRQVEALVQFSAEM